MSMSTTSPDTMSDTRLGIGWARPARCFAGRPGIRNHVVGLSTVGLTDRIVSLACERVHGSLAVTPSFERGLRGEDAALQARMIDAIVRHPNTGATLIVTQDPRAADVLRARHAELGKPHSVLALLDCAGMDDAVNQAAKALTRLTSEAADLPRAPVRLSDLCVVLECGASDASSAVCANPAIGRFVDGLVAAGGTAIVSETAEFLGAEDVIRRQSASPEIANRILGYLSAKEAMMKADGEDYRGVNPTAENIDAGLTTLTEKTMGAVCKIGHSPFVGALAYGEAPQRPGLHFMDTTFFSPTSITGMALAGGQICLFAIGVFNPSAVPLVPTLKICGNPQTLSAWQDGIDVDVSGLITGSETLDQAAQAISAKIKDVIGGQQTATEEWGEGQIILPRTLPAI